jgi:phospholipid transport system substrate-binding protein
MILKRKLFAVLALILLNLANAYAAAEDAEAARQVVETFQAKLLETMKKGKELGYQGRYDMISQPVIDSHDVKKISRIVVGKAWKTADDEQKKKWTDVFTQLSIASYAHNFKDFSGESFRFESAEETRRGRIIIHTTFLIPDDKNVKFDYLMSKKGDHWMIINIIANGVSDLALKRSEYSSILQKNGFDTLIAQISDKISNYAKIN